MTYDFKQQFLKRSHLGPLGIDKESLKVRAVQCTGVWVQSQLSNVVCLRPCSLGLRVHPPEVRRSSLGVGEVAAQHSGVHPRPWPQDSLFHLYLGFISENTLVLFTAVEIKKTSSGGISFSLTFPDHGNKQRIVKEAIQWHNGSPGLVSLPALCHWTIQLTSKNLRFFTHEKKIRIPILLIYWVSSTVKWEKECKYFANTHYPSSSYSANPYISFHVHFHSLPPGHYHHRLAPGLL